MNPTSAFARAMLTGAVGLALAVQPASANVRGETSPQTPRLRDLDLNRSDNAQALLWLRRPATLVCAGSPGLTPMVVPSHDAHKCVWQASSDAVGAARPSRGPRDLRPQPAAGSDRDQLAFRAPPPRGLGAAVGTAGAPGRPPFRREQSGRLLKDLAWSPLDTRPVLD